MLKATSESAGRMLGVNDQPQPQRAHDHYHDSDIDNLRLNAHHPDCDDGLEAPPVKRDTTILEPHSTRVMNMEENGGTTGVGMTVSLAIQEDFLLPSATHASAPTLRSSNVEEHPESGGGHEHPTQATSPQMWSFRKDSPPPSSKSPSAPADAPAQPLLSLHEHDRPIIRSGCRKVLLRSIHSRRRIKEVTKSPRAPSRDQQLFLAAVDNLPFRDTDGSMGDFDRLDDVADPDHDSESDRTSFALAELLCSNPSEII